MPTETFTLYYNVNQLKKVQNMDHTNLYSDRDRKSVVGKAFYIINSYNEDDNFSWAFEYATFYLNNKDTLIFQNSQFQKTTILKTGTYIFQILGGSGKYLGAQGTITFVVNDAGLRTIKLKITY